MSKDRESITLLMQELGLTIKSTFVPFSQSRSKDEKMPNLNWRVSVRKDGREVLATDYSAGYGHCPAYKASVARFGGRDSIARDAAIRSECETGHERLGNAQFGIKEGKAIMPDPLDVMHSLSMDSDVLDAGGFESWASDFGYDTDSRKAEKTYQACLDIALKLRSAIGEDGLNKLREAFQDY